MVWVYLHDKSFRHNAFQFIITIEITFGSYEWTNRLPKVVWQEKSQTPPNALDEATNENICQWHSYEDSPRLPCSDTYLQGERVLSSYLSLVSHFSSHSLIYLSMYSVLSTIVQKGGDCWCNSLPLCVLEIVDRNSHGLICLLVHIERNSPCSAEENAISGVQFEELHRRLTTSKRRTSYILWRLVDEKNEVKELTPRKFHCWREAIGSVILSEEIDCSNGRRRRSEDVAFFSSFFFHSFES